ncbi:MAG: helix-turn-helix domain-containing protein [Clostridia bacterium]|nr:helix-turn-helix domain-containing protein [Clostridia bacterium]
MIIEFKVINISNDVKTHSHDYGQFVLPYDGAVHIEFDGKSYVIDSNSIGYIPPSVNHKYNGEKNDESLIINVNPTLIKESDREIFLNNCRYIFNDRVKIIVDYIKSEAKNRDISESDKYLFFYVYDKIVEVRKYKSVSYIHENYQENIKISTLAELECYNTTYYTDWFKSHAGMPPSEYIKRVRIDKAKDLLLTTQYNLTQIASQAGYSHSSTMCAAFKEVTGITPKEYRNQNF